MPLRRERLGERKSPTTLCVEREKHGKNPLRQPIKKRYAEHPARHKRRHSLVDTELPALHLELFEEKPCVFQLRAMIPSPRHNNGREATRGRSRAIGVDQWGGFKNTKNAPVAFMPPSLSSSEHRSLLQPVRDRHGGFIHCQNTHRDSRGAQYNDDSTGRVQLAGHNCAPHAAAHCDMLSWGHRLIASKLNV